VVLKGSEALKETGRVETTTRQRNALMEAMPFGALLLSDQY